MRRLRYGTLIVAGAVALATGAAGVHAQAAQVMQAAQITQVTQVAAPPAKPASAIPPMVAKPASKPASKTADKPLWNQLTPGQKTALEPLHGEWDAMEGVRKQKWLQFTKSFTTMNPDEQQRVHERMREWIRLTPEQRKLARSNYIQSKTIAPGEKTATWESYQQLPDAQKQKLAEQATRKPLTNLPAAKAAPHPTAPALHAQVACPAGSVRNTAAAVPACVPVPAAPAQPVAQAPAAVTASAPVK